MSRILPMTAAMQNEIERADPARFGVAQKCTFCSDRVDFGLENDLTPGIDPRATPACVNSCIADALHFGDVDDPNSNVSRLLREQRSFRMHAELGTDPGFHYLYGKANGAGTGAEPACGRRRDGRRANRARAASSRRCNSIGTGRRPAISSAAAWAADCSCSPRSPAFGMASLRRSAGSRSAIVALGLSLLLLKIGRPLRFIYVLRQPQRSWMTREAWIAAVFFPLAALALWFRCRRC